VETAEKLTRFIATRSPNDNHDAGVKRPPFFNAPAENDELTFFAATPFTSIWIIDELCEY